MAEEKIAVVLTRPMNVGLNEAKSETTYRAERGERCVFGEKLAMYLIGVGKAVREKDPDTDEETPQAKRVRAEAKAAEKARAEREEREGLAAERALQDETARADAAEARARAAEAKTSDLEGRLKALEDAAAAPGGAKK